jgi:hypothetical protein
VKPLPLGDLAGQSAGGRRARIDPPAGSSQSPVPSRRTRSTRPTSSRTIASTTGTTTAAAAATSSPRLRTPVLRRSTHVVLNLRSGSEVRPRTSRTGFSFLILQDVGSVRMGTGGFWQSSQHVQSRAESLVRVERTGVGSVAGAGTGRHTHASRALRVPAGPACGRPLTRGTLRPWGRELRAGRWPRPPHAPATSCPGGGDQRGEPTRRTGGRSPRWACGSRGVFGAGR